MKSFIKPMVATLMAMSLAFTLTANAAPKEKGESKGKAKAEGKAEAPGQAKAKATPYGGTLSAKTADSITVKKKEAEKTFTVTATTKIIKAGKPATLADGVIGEEVGVSYIENEGKAEAKSIRLGAKPEKAGGEKKEKKSE